MAGNRFLTDVELCRRSEMEPDDKAILRDICEAVVLFGILGLAYWFSGATF